MSQTIALHAKAPQISLADVMQEVQRSRQNDIKLQGMERENELDSITKGQQIDEANALGRYRTRQGAKDPAAIEELDAYPEAQKKLYDAFDGMSPQQYMEAGKKANAFGAAARRVSAFAEGSPQQAQVWAEEIDRLAKDGFIDPKNAEQWKAQGPNMAIVNEALTIGDWVKGYKGKNALEQARIEEIKGRTANAEKKTEGQLGRYRTQNEKDQSLIEDKGVDNERADEDLARKTKKTEADIAKAAKTKEADGLRVEKGISDLLNKKRKELQLEEEDLTAPEDGKTDLNAAPDEGLARRKQAYRAYEAELRKKYEVKGANTEGKADLKPLGASPDNPYIPKNKQDAMSQPPGTYFLGPDGKVWQVK